MNRLAYTIAETFVGAGGSHYGFKLEKFKTLFVNDISKVFIKTLLHNNSELKNTALISSVPIEQLNEKKVLKEMNIKKGELDVLFGGTVCKGYSLAGMRDPNDKRNKLYLEQLRLVKAWKPKVSIIENVPAIGNALIYRGRNKKLLNEISSVCKKLGAYTGRLSALRKQNETLSKLEERKHRDLKLKKKELENKIKEKSIFVLEDIKATYDKLGYIFYYEKLNAGWYGSATKRNRIVMVAVRKDIKKEFKFPTITHINKEIDTKIKLKKVKETKKAITINNRLKTLDKNNNPKLDLDNIPMNHTQKTIKRFSFIPKGGNIVEVMEKLPDDLKISGFYSRGCTMRLDGNKLSPTLVPGHSNFPVHPKLNRSITVREAASITGFPNNYKFFGSHTQRCEQVGNAVPVELSNALAKEVKKVLNYHYDSE